MAKHRHKRETNARAIPRAALVAAPVAVLATVSAVTLGVVQADPAPQGTYLADTQRVEAAIADRTQPVSRAAVRRGEAVVTKRVEARKAEAQERRATQRAVANADTRLWTTVALNLWSASGKAGEKVGLLDAGKKVLVTGREADGREELVVNGKSRWVTAGYLSADKPVATTINGDCTNGTSVPSNVDPSIIKVHRAVCAAFPQVTTYGTWRSDGEHGQGRAVDIMVSGETGWAIAEMLRANHASLGIEYLIYAQKIWSVERSGEGWRGMSDRGSTTANHYDHVHVTVY
ncbi:SH3 domain-containing protein [Nocardioides sp. Y6]|uniref:SH3 domain-containing protein n=1 Tax=Nocardioides malaquae TaxID=2773426 RepID=A0ABR9RQ65_9ACTN|nr:SH3 domain-containing protein [Nocardioides malaquae]MBE7323711.1 SH3 domain-containing protein [Nocardioides malaquae]